MHDPKKRRKSVARYAAILAIEVAIGLAAFVALPSREGWTFPLAQDAQATTVPDFCQG